MGVVQVRIVRVAVSERRVLVSHGLMRVIVIVPLGQMQPKTKRHQATCDQ